MLHIINDTFQPSLCYFWAGMQARYGAREHLAPGRRHAVGEPAAQEATVAAVVAAAADAADAVYIPWITTDEVVELLGKVLALGKTAKKLLSPYIIGNWVVVDHEFNYPAAILVLLRPAVCALSLFGHQRRRRRAVCDAQIGYTVYSDCNKTIEAMDCRINLPWAHARGRRNHMSWAHAQEY